MTGSTMANESAARAWQARQALARLAPRLAETLAAADPGEAAEFHARLERHWPQLFGHLLDLYGGRWDFFYHLEQILLTVARGWLARPPELRALDHTRELDPAWFTSPGLAGGALYVQLFAENLGKLRGAIPYFQDLGLTYVHLMPLFAVRPGNNDGGYAISDYRSVDPGVGSIDDLRALAADLRRAGIALVLDFVFNHTADDHQWARRAQAGEREFQEFYHIFPDRSIPDRYELHLREIFPTVRRGNFTWHDGMERWVWTTFNSFQWDLNYHNPAVFRAMLDELLFLANTGVDILRLDAVAFIWKRLGTPCENLPEAHVLIRAFNAAVRVAAPGLLFKSEAIVHPDEVARYIAVEECQLSYNPTLMALLWEALATREVKLLARSLGHRHRLPPGCTWVNYLRCHDDIGWSFDDGDARAAGIDPFPHRRFLNEFYTGQFPGSFARGIPFQSNEATGDMRISGTLASLAGLEQAIEEENASKKELAVRRILLLHSVILSIGGIPLIYLGEEWGALNDYDFVTDPAKAGDTRWVHRPRMRWEFLAELADDGSLRKRLFTSFQRLIRIRRDTPAFTGIELELLATGNPHVLGYLRAHAGDRVIVLANFSEAPCEIDGNRLRVAGYGRFFEDLAGGRTHATASPLTLAPYEFLWLRRT
jgi:amylosucrase